MENEHRFQPQRSRTAHAGLRRPFFYQCMSSCYDDLVQFVQQFRCKQSNVIHQGLVSIFPVFIIQAMAEHLPQGSMLVAQLMKTVVVDIQVQTQYAKNQNTPECHAGTAILLVHCGCNFIFQQRKYLFA